MLKIIFIFSISILFSFCNYENYITSIIEVKTIGKYELYSKHNIISSYEKFYERDCSGSMDYCDDFDDKLANEKQIKNVEIFINGTNIGFSYDYKFYKNGNYSIVYKFKEPLKSAAYLFSFCDSIVSLDLSHFNSNYINDTSYMFYFCDSLRFINFSNFNTQNVVNMNEMFGFCKSLSSLNLNSFNTSKVQTTLSMFSGCKSLKSLDLSNFDTSNMNDISSMFYYCENLSFLNLSNFKTKKINNLSFLFGH